MAGVYSACAKALLKLSDMLFFEGIARRLLMFIFPPVTVNNLLEWDDHDRWDDTDDLWFGASAIFYVFMDPLLMYVPLINEKTKCVMLDNRLKIAAIVLRLFGDVRYLARIIYRIKDGKRKSHSLKKIANDMWCILPVPQVVTFIVLPKLRGSRSWKIMRFFNMLILLQYSTRLYPIFKLYKQVNKKILNLLKKNPKDMPDDNERPIHNPRRLGITINIIGYILASHVLGAFWYFFSIQREIACWGFACQIENGCEFSTSCVENTFRNITHIKNLCPVNPPNATVFDFGIFLYALQSGMQGSTNFFEKVLQCSSWGLRNLSSFASNLNSSTYELENLFVVVISISGLILFMYLLGHSQTYMQEFDKRESAKHKMKMSIKTNIKLLLSSYGFADHQNEIYKLKMDLKKKSKKMELEEIKSKEKESKKMELEEMESKEKELEEELKEMESKQKKTKEMVGKIKEVVKLILEKDEDFIVDDMFSILSFNFPDERQHYKKYFDLRIKNELFRDKLEKVKRIKDKDPEVRRKIIEHLEPMIYTEGSYIIREGEPLDMMFFVTQGIVLTYATNNGGSSSSSTIQLIKKEKESLYGEELLTLAEGPLAEGPLVEGPSTELSTLPISPVTVKSHKKVEIFALKAVDLLKVFFEVPNKDEKDMEEIVSAQA